MHFVRWIILGFFFWSTYVQCEEKAPDLILPPPEAMAPEEALPSKDHPLPPEGGSGVSAAPLNAPDHEGNASPPKNSEANPPPPPPPAPKNRTLIYGSQTYADCVGPSPWKIETLP